ncbi:helicase C-terminal domain-containing protein [Bacillus sp. FJAT-45066]|uniref:helicase C-terminal domain-containing protein n=1 Tax=Bacillus sp. FJAT-45066 TaxID=2011010 RepID=UPI000BB9B74F|nr:helicase C-terminal domain-containing protein [Bacillus sp. FJAT-45066]
MEKQISVSVRKLVEFSMMSGSIHIGSVFGNVLEEGTKTHQRLQENRGDNYEKEVYVSYTSTFQELEYKVDGRCDGIIREENLVIVEEIKSTGRTVSELLETDYPTYWAQAKVYAYIIGKQEGLEEIGVHLVYANRKSFEKRSFQKIFSINELETFYEEVIDTYITFHLMITQQQQLTKASIEKLDFPFQTFRKGQRSLMNATYKSISENKRLFAKASTGIGKTISTIFPTLKQISVGKAKRIMYVTAKNSTRKVAEDTFHLLINKGLRAKVITITAKEKVCFQEEVRCQKDYCPFANGYYDRLQEGLIDILTNENLMNTNTIEFYARKHQLCPFEFSLDVALYADVIICDYNYFFNPKVKLQRWTEYEKETVLLIDEAHNLVDRARNMYSSSIQKSSFLSLSRELKNKNKELYQVAKLVNNELLKWKKEMLNQNVSTHNEVPESLVEVLQNFYNEAEIYLQQYGKAQEFESVKEVYFMTNAFLKATGWYNDHFKTLTSIYKSEVEVKILCLDPSLILNKMTKKLVSSIFFSATLMPLGYFTKVLGGTDDDYHLSLSSPFPIENVEVSVAPISTKYKDRSDSVSKIVNVICSELHKKNGNYLVFFPSYEYMSQVLEVYENYQVDGVKVIIQSHDMTEEERSKFLNEFEPNDQTTLIGFSVLGGVFAEGIDLVGEKLNGVMIIGVGLPRISDEQNIMKDYYQKQGVNGFDFAYVYPGMNKVHQAGGRLIRSETDTGFIWLVDDRFLTNKYLSLLPEEWRNFKILKY